MLVQTDDDLARFCALAAGLTPAQARAHAPDASLVAERGRCSLWWRGTPGGVAFLGHAAGEVPFDEALALLRAQGCRRVVGPIDGSTWRRYRLVVDHGEEPPFLLEPWNGPEDVARWEAAGFAPVRHYTSAVGPLGEVDPRAVAAEARLAAEGYAIRDVDAGRWEEELRRIYPLLTASFAQNYLYAPLPEDEYLDLYRPLRPLAQPGTTLLAERGDEVVGLFFAYPTSADTHVFKTLAVHPRHEGKGLGGALTARAIRAAAEAGFRRAIHALMEESNRSQRISRHYGAPMRRYALFGRSP